jgi:hypothetical protein
MSYPSWDAVEPPGSGALPEGPGLYGWMRDQQIMFLGAARSLRKRIQQFELRRPVAGRRQPSPLRERVALYLLRDTEVSIPWRGVRRQEAVDAWLGGCSVAWKAMPVAEAQRHVDEALEEGLPLLHQWRPRPREDEWLATYLADADRRGVAYAEVPIGGGPGSGLRRIDAVRVPGDQQLEIRYHHQRRFDRDRHGAGLEVIEVKESLNRPVVGQLIVARDLIRRQWRDIRALSLVAVVRRDDALIHQLCDQVYDIRVVVVPPNSATTRSSSTRESE